MTFSHSSVPAQANSPHSSETPFMGPDVPINIDAKEYLVHRGHITVVQLKALAAVPLAYELEQIVNGKLVLLPDAGDVTLKGDERFISHPREGASS